jgi:hypothetical protein
MGRPADDNRAAAHRRYASSSNEGSPPRIPLACDPSHPPSAADENRQPQQADVTYASAIDWLRERTRSTAKFPLLHEELTSYGFRRNLLGIKPWGLLVSVGAAIACSIRELVWPPADPLVLTLSWVCAAFGLLAAAFWLFHIRPDWVKFSAFTYARALVATCDELVCEGGNGRAGGARGDQSKSRIQSINKSSMSHVG